MLLAERYGQRCFYCAFRGRQVTLQQCRTKWTTSREAADFWSGKRRRNGRDDISRLSEARRFKAKGGLPEGKHGRNAKSRGDGQQRQKQHRTYSEILERRLQLVKQDLKKSPTLEQLRKEGQDINFHEIWQRLEIESREYSTYFDPAKDASIKGQLRRSFLNGGESGLDARIRYHFFDLAIGPRFSKTDIENQKMLADLRYPAEWYPATRSLQRQVHLHVGPTNSGKTYHALQRLEKAKTGIYAGPLRLLAHEVYSRLNAKGIRCGLLTGEERRTPSGHRQGEEKPPLRAVESSGRSTNEDPPEITAYTVEMVPVNRHVEVAVIDEIQMIGSGERGWAWTGALLGVKADEVHLCGEERAVPLIQQICATVNDELIIHRYERLSPLRTADESLRGDLSNLQKGDCIVSFSVMGIHALRKQIENKTGKKVATVYGSLPPETRAQQARLFNDPDNDYDFLVASDAVGMGLNLAIRRVVFESVSKFNGVQQRILPIADIKQIAGRAGRYRVASMQETNSAKDSELAAAKGDGPPELPEPENVGYVTTLEEMDLPFVRQAMETEPEPIHSAGVFPPAPILERFSNYFPPGTPFSYIMTRLHELSQTHRRYHLCGLKDHTWIADLIEPVKNLSIGDRSVFCACPSNARDGVSTNLLPALARCIAEQREANVLDLAELPLENLELQPTDDRKYLRELERLHKGLGAYLWLSYRFPGTFTTRPLAFHIKFLVEEKIEAALEKMSSTSERTRRKILEKRRQMAQSADAIDELDDGETDDVLDRFGEEISLTGGTDRFDGEDVPWDEPQIDEAGDKDTGNDQKEGPDPDTSPSTTPAKHLHELDFTATETERRVESRP